MSNLNLSPSGYGKIDRGEVDLTISRLFEIAEVLKVSPSSLIFLDFTVLFINQKE
jgi:transcriptional regulator with XRE-family HTH domain